MHAIRSPGARPECPACGGAWSDAATIARLARRSASSGLARPCPVKINTKFCPAELAHAPQSAGARRSARLDPRLQIQPRAPHDPQLARILPAERKREKQGGILGPCGPAPLRNAADNSIISSLRCQPRRRLSPSSGRSSRSTGNQPVPACRVSGRGNNPGSGGSWAHERVAGALGRRDSLSAASDTGGALPRACTLPNSPVRLTGLRPCVVCNARAPLTRRVSRSAVLPPWRATLRRWC